MIGIVRKIFHMQSNQFPVTVEVTMEPPTFEEFILAGANGILENAYFNLIYLGTPKKKRKPFHQIMLEGVNVAFNSTTIFNTVSGESLVALPGTATSVDNNNHVVVYVFYPTTLDAIPSKDSDLIQQLIQEYACEIKQPVTLKIERVYAKVY